MKIYETGDSVKLQVSLGTDRAAIPEATQFICVLDDTDISLEQGKTKMLEQLDITPDNISSEDEYSVTLENGVTYELAHERIIEKDFSVIYRPSNLLRHIYSLNFTIDMLYRNEEGEVIDISGNGSDDLHNNLLRTITPVKKLLAADNKAIIDIIYARVAQGRRLHRDIEFCLTERLDYIKPLEGTYSKIKEIVRSANTFHNYMYMMETLPALRDYMQRSGIKFEVSFQPTDADKENWQVALKNFQKSSSMQQAKKIAAQKTIAANKASKSGEKYPDRKYVSDARKWTEGFRGAIDVPEPQQPKSSIRWSAVYSTPLTQAEVNKVEEPNKPDNAFEDHLRRAEKSYTYASVRTNPSGSISLKLQKPTDTNE